MLFSIQNLSSDRYKLYLYNKLELDSKISLEVETYYFAYVNDSKNYFNFGVSLYERYYYDIHSQQELIKYLVSLNILTEKEKIKIELLWANYAFKDNRFYSFRWKKNYYCFWKRGTIVNYFFSIIANSGNFEFSALLYTPFFASTDEPNEMYPVYSKIFTGEKKIEIL